jgi:predicted ATPase
MLSEITIDGFRSLLNFQLNLQPGLNVIVGANGTGKSNFISFLDFLSELGGDGVNAAIAIAQGAGSVFSKERFQDDSVADLTFTLKGEISSDATREYMYSEIGADYTSAKYEYTVHLKYERSIPAVYIASEVIFVSDDASDVPLFVERKTYFSGGNFETRISIDSDHPFYAKSFRWMRDEDDFTLESALSEKITPDRLLLSMMSMQYAPLVGLYMDIVGHRSVNIDPVLARKPSPVGSNAKLQTTGEGLAGVLYQLQNGSYSGGGGLLLFRHHSRDSQLDKFNSIMSWCREVNPSIENVVVDLEFFQALLIPYMAFDFDGESAKFPFSRVSDGTIKWLSLATILFTSDNLSVIEEPENFLHPFMQEAFIALCRQIVKRSPQRSIIISTHSPTLLDCCSPLELTIFELYGGATRSSRVANRQELADKVASSSFGLGYYYKTGGVYGEDRRLS